MAEQRPSIDIAREHLQKQEFDAARDAYLKALQEMEDKTAQSIIWAELCWTYYRLKDYDRCIEAANRCLKLDPGYGAREDLFRLVGYSFVQLKQEDRAIEFLEQSLRLDRESLKQQYVIFELAKIYFRRQEYEKAGQYLNEVETFFYQNNFDYWFSARYMKGFNFYYQKDIDEAEKVFEELLEKADDEERRAMAMFGLAFVAFEQKQYLQTINLCEAIIKMQPSFYDKETIGFLTAASFHYLGRNDVFEKYYAQMIKKYPDGRYRKELDLIKSKINN